jgi:hypothetical protein
MVLKKHKLGTDWSEDEVVYFERRYWGITSIGKEKLQKKYILISSLGTLTTEFKDFIEADKPRWGNSKSFQKRKEVWGVFHFRDHFLYPYKQGHQGTTKLMESFESKTSDSNQQTSLAQRRCLIRGYWYFRETFEPQSCAMVLSGKLEDWMVRYYSPLKVKLIPPHAQTLILTRIFYDMLINPQRHLPSIY